MRRIHLIAASMIACSSAIAAQQSTSNQEDGPVASVGGDAPVALDDVSPSYVVPGLLSLGGASSGNEQNDVSRSNAGALALPPVTPFVTRAPTGDTAVDREQYRLVQEIRERERRLLEDPEYRELQKSKHRLTLNATHPELAEILQIPKEQADRLLDLLAEHRVREEAAAIPMLPGPTDPAALQALIDGAEERRRVADAELIALLGPDKYQAWKEYDQNAIARFQVQRFRSRLPEDSPLRTDQVRSLVSVIAREQGRLFALGRPIALHVPDDASQKRIQEQSHERMSEAHQRILDASATFLSSRQLEYLQAMLQEDLDLHAQPIVTSIRSDLSPAPLHAEPARP